MHRNAPTGWCRFVSGSRPGRHDEITYVSHMTRSNSRSRPTSHVLPPLQAETARLGVSPGGAPVRNVADLLARREAGRTGTGHFSTAQRAHVTAFRCLPMVPTKQVRQIAASLFSLSDFLFSMTDGRRGACHHPPLPEHGAGAAFWGRHRCKGVSPAGRCVAAYLYRNARFHGPPLSVRGGPAEGPRL